jgi:hypothetical protein
MHSPKPLSESEILDIMPMDKSIAAIYSRMSDREKISNPIPTRGDAII